MSVRRYQQAQETVEDARAIEHRMLSRITAMLVEGKKRGGRDLIEACYYNRKLWTVFQADLVNPTNALPDELKARLISLSLWVQGYTGQVLEGASIEPLIDVNRQIMEGLKPPVAPTPRAAAPAHP